MVSNVRLGSVGGNFQGYDNNDITIRYDSKFKDGRVCITLRAIRERVIESYDKLCNCMSLLYSLFLLR